MAVRGLTYRQVRRRQVGAFAAIIAATALLVVATPLVGPTVGGVVALVVLVAYLGLVCAGLVVCLSARTDDARRVVETGGLASPHHAELGRELQGLRASYTFGLVVAAVLGIVPALGVLSAALSGTARLGPLLLAAGIVLLGVVVAAFWSRWLWRRRVNVADVLEQLSG